MLRALNKASYWIDRACMLICGVLMSAIFVSCVLQVFFRFVLNSSLIWSEELMRFSFIWMIMLATASTIRSQTNTCIDIVATQVKGSKLEKPHFILIQVLVIIACVILFWQGYRYIAKVGIGAASSALRIPMPIVYAALPVGGGLTVFYSLVLVLNSIMGYTDEKKEGKKA